MDTLAQGGATAAAAAKDSAKSAAGSVASVLPDAQQASCALSLDDMIHTGDGRAFESASHQVDFVHRFRPAGCTDGLILPAIQDSVFATVFKALLPLLIIAVAAYFALRKQS